MQQKDILEMVSQSYLLSQLTPSIIHEFNNIFTAVISTTQLMLEYEDDPKNLKEGFNEIQTYIEKAVSLNRTIASFFLDSNREKELVSIDFFRYFHELLDKEFKSNNTKIIYKHNEEQPVLLSAQLLKVMVQLILNAQDESNKSDIIIETDKKGDKYIINVMNIGNYINEYKKIFDLGYTDKDDRSVNDRYKRKHFGVGLSMSKHIVEELNGVLKYKYEDNKNIFSIIISIK